MQGFENDKFIFYTAGKIGTRTLMYTEGMTDITPLEDIHFSLRKEVLDFIISKRESTGKKLVILIREPLLRFHSGLFEIIAKCLGGPFIKQMLSQGGDISFIKSSVFWGTYIEHCLRFSPKVWLPHKDFEGHRWQYHIGNWLHDAETASEIFTDSIIVNITDLSNFLVDNNIPNSHLNDYSNIVPSEYQYDTKEVFDAFIQGLKTRPNRVLQYNNYLISEKECYERLINSPQYYKVG
jgi:hypothetical protein